jgi:hypothetical protein
LRCQYYLSQTKLKSHVRGPISGNERARRFSRVAHAIKHGINNDFPLGTFVLCEKLDRNNEVRVTLPAIQGLHGYDLLFKDSD